MTTTSKIVRNSVKCLVCNDEIESRHRHDFKWCKCENIAVDGGKDYCKRSGGSKGKYEDTSIFQEVEDK